MLLVGGIEAIYPQETARERIERKQQSESLIQSSATSIRMEQMNRGQDKEIENAKWSRVIYRYLDLSREANAPLYYTGAHSEGRIDLFSMIFRLLQAQRIQAYEYLDGREEFTEEYLIDFSELLRRFDIYHDTVNGTIVVNDADVPTKEVLGYYLKEAYYFDNTTSTLRVKPLALCPILFRHEEVASSATRYPLFWIPYSELEPYTRRIPVMSSAFNNSISGTIDDFFRKRSYYGEIYKTMNPRNLAISQYTSTPEEMKAEQERIEKELIDFEKLIRSEEKAVTLPRQTSRRGSKRISAGTPSSSGNKHSMRDRRY